MKAAYIETTGPAENIRIGDLPTPVPGAGEVLVKIAASAVNPIDEYIRSGTVAMPIPKQFIPGCDLAGTVVALGSGSHRFQIGDRVWGSNQGLLGRQGTLAEFAAVHEHFLYPTPDNVTDVEAAAVSLVALTAHLGLVRDANVQSGETVFVNGGTGGVGAMVVQIAKALGARVITTCGTDAKCQLARELGADEAINYNHHQVEHALKQFAPDGVHVWWETLRKPNFDRTIEHLTTRGRMILMAGREACVEFPVGPFYLKECRLFGFVVFKASHEEQAAAASDINHWLTTGKLKAVVGKTFPLTEAAKAHSLQYENTLCSAGTLTGKIVVTME